MDNELNDWIDRENVNEYNKNGYTKLYIAVAKNDIKKVNRLLHLGADPNIPNADSYYPIHVAVKNNSLKIIRSLLRYCADVDKECGEGDTALLIAISSENYAICEILLDNGANPNYVNYYGIVPLLRAIICDSDDIVRLLLDKGANPNHVIKKCDRTYTVLESLKDCSFKNNSSSLTTLISEIVISRCKENFDEDGFKINASIIANDQHLRSIALKCKMELNVMYTTGIKDKSIFKLCIMKEYDKINKNILVNYLDKLIEISNTIIIYRRMIEDVINIAIKRKELLIMTININYYAPDKEYSCWKHKPLKERLKILQHFNDDMLTRIILKDALNRTNNTNQKIEKQ
ncbi:SWPV1-021 [Shearwaterpox virus]|uniref:SWPV1-021 n=1 Tax=Shearwaterpox virus TaxID=1974596 RepID=A0A1V0S7P2_CNPV|nr:SWPV1-021 [Shearwaterpox virus]